MSKSCDVHILFKTEYCKLLNSFVIHGVKEQTAPMQQEWHTEKNKMKTETFKGCS